jgi:hypothetical protein
VAKRTERCVGTNGAGRRCFRRVWPPEILCSSHRKGAVSAVAAAYRDEDRTDPLDVMRQMMSDRDPDRALKAATLYFDRLQKIDACPRCAASRAGAQSVGAFLKRATEADLEQARGLLRELKALRMRVCARPDDEPSRGASVGERQSDHEPPASQE